MYSACKFFLIVCKIIMHFGINCALQSTKCESLGAYSGDSYRDSEGEIFHYFLKVRPQNSPWLSELHGFLELYCQLPQPPVTCSHLNLT